MIQVWVSKGSNIKVFGCIFIFVFFSFNRSQSMHDPPQVLGLNATMPNLLQRIMTNPATTVEELERQHRGDIPRDQMPQPAGAEAPTEAPTAPMPSRVVSGAAKTSVSSMSTSTTAFWQSLGSGSSSGINNGPGSGSQSSPDTALKRSLNMLPTRVTLASVSTSSKTASMSPGNGGVTTVSSGTSALVRTTSAHEQMMLPQSSGGSTAVGDAGGLVQRLAAMATGGATPNSPATSSMTLSGIPPAHAVTSRASAGGTGTLPAQSNAEVSKLYFRRTMVFSLVRLIYIKKMWSIFPASIGAH